AFGNWQQETSGSQAVDQQAGDLQTTHTQFLLLPLSMLSTARCSKLALRSTLAQRAAADDE
ncbi:unnamed protein product, partial [Ceratitis capitata]